MRADRSGRGWQRIGTIRVDLFRLEQWFVPEHFAQEALCGVEIALWSQKENPRVFVSTGAFVCR